MLVAPAIEAADIVVAAPVVRCVASGIAVTTRVPPSPTTRLPMLKLADEAAMRKRFGKAARRLTETKFSSAAIGREAVALYDRLIGR